MLQKIWSPRFSILFPPPSPPPPLPPPNVKDVTWTNIWTLGGGEGGGTLQKNVIRVNLTKECACAENLKNAQWQQL